MLAVLANRTYSHLFLGQATDLAGTGLSTMSTIDMSTRARRGAEPHRYPRWHAPQKHRHAYFIDLYHPVSP